MAKENKNNYMELRSRAIETGPLGAKNSRSVSLSRPVITFADNRQLAVFMHYGDIYEDQPIGYCFVDIYGTSAVYMEAEQAMEYLGMPESIFLEPVDEDDYVDPNTDDIIDLFDKCIGEYSVDYMAYFEYLDRVLETVSPQIRPFYNFFR